MPKCININGASKQALIKAAIIARKNAYAPYSHFAVGAAVLYSDGSMTSGCNIENASYGATLCAERNAIAAGVAQGKLSVKTHIKAICISTNGDKGATPCGICRQVIWEFGHDIEILCGAKIGDYIHYTIANLLPYAFDLDRKQIITKL